MNRDKMRRARRRSELAALPERKFISNAAIEADDFWIQNREPETDAERERDAFFTWCHNVKALAGKVQWFTWGDTDGRWSAWKSASS